MKTIEDYQRPFWVVFKHCELSCILNVLEKRKKSAAMQDRRCILNTETTTQYYKKWPIMEYVRVKYGCEICLSIHYYRVSQKVWNMFIKKFWVRHKLHFLQKCVFINKNCLFSIFLLTVKCKKLLWSNNSSIYLIDYNIRTIALKSFLYFTVNLEMLKIQFLFIKTHFFENYDRSLISGHPVPYIVIEDTSSIHLTNDTLSCLSKKKEKGV